jgi:hypothetical protein
VAKYGKAGQITGDSTIRRMRFACWIIKATFTHSEYVIFILSRQQLCEGASVLRYTYIASPVEDNVKQLLWLSQPVTSWQAFYELSTAALSHYLGVDR